MSSIIEVMRKRELLFFFLGCSFQPLMYHFYIIRVDGYHQVDTTAREMEDYRCGFQKYFDSQCCMQDVRYSGGKCKYIVSVLTAYVIS